VNIGDVERSSAGAADALDWSMLDISFFKKVS